MYKILANSSFRTNHVHYLPFCHSTNEIAIDLLQGEVEEGTIVITDHQFEGKGQPGNQWLSEPYKNLVFSLILKPGFLKARDQFGLTMVVSLAIKQMLDQFLPGETSIKWPNDIFFKEKKIAGILIENSLIGSFLDSTVVGIGLNVNQSEFERLRATSMQLAAGLDYNLNVILNELVKELSVNYLRLKSLELESLKKEYHAAMLGIKQKRKFKADKFFTGEIVGTDDAGRLLIKTEGETRKFLNKEVEFLF